MRRFHRAVTGTVAFVCAASVVMAAVPIVAGFASSAATTTDYLNLRSGAGTNNKVILTLSKGVAVTVLDDSNAVWVKVRTAGGKTGYCSKQFLSYAGKPAGPSGGGSSVSGGSAVTTSSLNLRSGAGTSYSILATLKNGTSVKVIDSSNPTWTKVQISSGQQGFCSRQYLKFGSSGSPTVPPSSTGTTPSGSSASGVTTDYVKLRQGAGTNYKSLATLGKGLTLKILDTSNAQWVKVQTPDGKQGYCSKQYVKINSAPTTPTKPSAPSTPSTPAGTVLSGKTTSVLNLRSGAGTGYSIVATLAKGDTVTVLDNSNAAWAKVRTSAGKQGYCLKQYLTMTQTNTKPVANSGTGDTGANSNAGTGTGGNPASGDNSAGGNTSGGDSTTHTITGATVTADLLRLREQPDASAKILSNLSQGTALTVLDTSNSAWTKVQASGGLVGYVSSEFIKIHYSDDTSNADGLSLSASSQSVPAGKTFYIKASVTPGDTALNWTSSNPSVATVSNGYVYAVSNGTATITASAGSCKASCTVTVTDAEPVKTAFASPNIASTGSTVTFKAVTDTTRDAVRFEITGPDGTKTIDTTSYTEETKLDTHVRIWTATTTFTTPGSYTFTALSSQSGIMSSTGYTTNACVSAQQDFTTTTSEERRISDQMISLIASWEGYRATVYADQLTSNQVPTIGYGCTLGANAQFYNNMTETEAWSLLVNKINNSSYTSELNKMIQANNFRMNQNQADCLISFAYNVGPGYFNSSSEPDFKRIMENAVVPPDFGNPVPATVTMDTAVMSDANRTSSQVASVTDGTSVTVTGGNFSDTRSGWYQVRLSDGTTGWINSGYVSLSNSASLVHDLNYTNACAFGSEFIRWNQAGGKFYAGLFYRRMGEANAYNYGDYNAERYNKYNYVYPNAASGLN
ncbi:MAG TPA: SH3 domain-containing protein [Caproiciproducens sp.]|nr:SH3 domain-containing protein [Caproiciproducens sp.]